MFLTFFFQFEYFLIEITNHHFSKNYKVELIIESYGEFYGDDNDTNDLK
jgi:hypothetical protein